jgi:hypothetical protein
MLLKNSSHKSNHQQFFLIFLLIIAFLKLFFEKFDTFSLNNYVSLFGNYFLELFKTNYIYLKIISFLLYIGNVFVIIYILRKQKLIELHKYYPGFFYLLFNLFFLQTSMIIPLFINTIILIFLLPPFLNISEKNYKLEYGFVFGLFCGLIMLLYSPFIVFFLLIYLILIINGYYDWRSYIMPFLGLLILYIYFFSALYLFDYKNYSSLLNFYIHQFKWNPILFTSLNPFQIVSYSCIFVFYVLFSYLLFSKSSNMNIFVRKKFYFFLISSFIGLLFSFFLIECRTIGIIFFITILSAMGGICEPLIKRRFLYNILIFILLLSLILDFLYPYFYA